MKGPERQNPIAVAHGKRGGAGSGSHKNTPLDEHKGLERKSKYKKKPEDECE